MDGLTTSTTTFKYPKRKKNHTQNNNWLRYLNGRPLPSATSHSYNTHTHTAPSIFMLVVISVHKFEEATHTWWWKICVHLAALLMARVAYSFFGFDFFHFPYTLSSYVLPRLIRRLPFFFLSHNSFFFFCYPGGTHDRFWLGHFSSAFFLTKLDSFFGLSIWV